MITFKACVAHRVREVMSLCLLLVQNTVTCCTVANVSDRVLQNNIRWGQQDETVVHKETLMYLGCVHVCVCRWAHQPGESKHLIPLVSCVMSFTGTQRLAAAQVRHRVARSRYNSKEQTNNKKAFILFFYNRLLTKSTDGNLYFWNAILDNITLIWQI